ncbi:mitochondrial inner membrane i-AAA protease complex subunit Mgr1p [[Candida] jaroonii]|uniref:Mitochondrial inner membrane i-AAA protease complex subunit Mgr1p n=1 Tax=[Candida] jaroonii TaxID=467808 RepID=A0ACA9Y9E3_9ASCO|nr:mitochondrial inner membrane i-AAA protease complex subunit Mgr1p [[Candida] jaroonii]
MGVYIPPNNNNDKEEKPSYLPEFYQNPTVGLKLWGPLVPAADNLWGRGILCSIQMITGLVLFRKSRFYRKKNLQNLGLTNNWHFRTRKYSYLGISAYLLFQTALEMITFSVSFNPWVEEAKMYRALAIKNGETPHWWLGPRNYQPMTLKEFNNNLDKIITILENHEESTEDGINKLEFNLEDNIPVQQIHELIEIHTDIKQKNSQIFQNLLNTQLKDLNEMNRAQRIDDYLEGKLVLNKNYSKPSIQLGNHPLNDNEQFQGIWEKFNPWDELKIETDYDIRLIPKWHNIQEIEDNDNE